MNSGCAAKPERGCEAGPPSFRKVCRLTLWPQSEVMALRGGGQESFVFPEGRGRCGRGGRPDCACCPNTATGIAAIVGPFNTIASNKERCLASKKVQTPARWFNQENSNQSISDRKSMLIKWETTWSQSDSLSLSLFFLPCWQSTCLFIRHALSSVSVSRGKIKAGVCVRVAANRQSGAD